MISIVNKNDINKISVQKVTPTIFPDGTSQVWKLDLDVYKNGSVKIVWSFEQEAELIWVNQLIALLDSAEIAIDELYMPYLPYARQDKSVSNTTTFAKAVFLRSLLLDKVGKLTTLDAHSEHAAVKSYSAQPYINKAILEFKPDVLVFPDEGAYERYQNQIEQNDFEVLVLDKVRDQATGAIKSLTLDAQKTSSVLSDNQKEKHYRMLIIDDICDGGATFNHAALFLHEKYHCEIALYVTHGIFSKGYENMINAGIAEFFTTQSLIKNISGYALIEMENENDI
ncbi:phosphoribosyltransferase family protein [Methylotenera sp.]|uniref:phosphoribosyltransferase family protein n=1 Tax=Methylotenera sp. TaxID=2051956 RepID=UPI0024889055|nr:phosphoribosyltransferase family protein [Methylotenera sp.]MDI1298059.1 phosphoribosyltransferase family protein [Methylotenera sp.]